MDAFDILDGISLDEGWKKLAASVTDKDYRKLVSYANCTSYSQLTGLHTCPRMAGHQFVVRISDGQLTKLHGGEVVAELPAIPLNFEDKKQGDLF